MAGIASEVLGEARWMVSITTPRAADSQHFLYGGEQRAGEEGEEGRREEGIKHRIGKESVLNYMYTYIHVYTFYIRVICVCVCVCVCVCGTYSSRHNFPVAKSFLTLDTF